LLLALSEAERREVAFALQYGRELARRALLSAGRDFSPAVAEVLTALADGVTSELDVPETSAVPLSEDPYSPEQAAELLGCRATYVRRVLRNGVPHECIRGWKVGGLWCVDRAFLDAGLAARDVEVLRGTETEPGHTEKSA
jgi:excisionase family DNA binding protein